MVAIKLWSMFSNNWIFKWASVALVGITVYWGHKTFIEKQAVKAFISDSKKEGRKKNAKAKKIRAATAKPGAAARLLKFDCHDC